MYYPKELFSINETQTRRNIAAYDAQQDRIYNECLRICPNYSNMDLKARRSIRKYVENHLIYIPVYDNGWKVVEVDPKQARYFHGAYDDYMLYHGTTYNAVNLYATKDGATAYIEKCYGIANLDRIDAQYIDWKEMHKTGA